MRSPADESWDGESYCVNRCGRPATHRALSGMVDGVPLYELVCRVCDSEATVPSSVKVGPFTVTVELCELPEDRDGEFDAAAQHIRLRATVPATYLRYLLLHEVIHAVAFAYGFDEDDEEAAASRLGFGLLQVIRDNEELVRFLVGE